jgi:hypothetical protein
MRERDVQKAILDWLQAKHIFAIRQNTGAMRSEYKGKSRFIRFGIPGQADILVFPWIYNLQGNGPYLINAREIVPVWIEVKGEKGRQSELQKSFQAQVEAEGHRYVLARSLDDVIAVLGGAT